MDCGFSELELLKIQLRMLVWYKVKVMIYDFQLPMQSVSITTKVVSSNPVHGEVYSIQHYVLKFVSNLWQVGVFLLVLRLPRYNWNIVESGIKHHKPNHDKLLTLW